MPSLHLTIWITNLNVLVQLAEEWISIGENVGPLKLSRFFFLWKIQYSHLAEEGRVSGHEGRQRVEDNMLLPFLQI